MAITDLMVALEKQVTITKKAQEDLDVANTSQKRAQDNYSTALAKYDELRTQINEAMGNMFGSDRVRQY